MDKIISFREFSAKKKHQPIGEIDYSTTEKYKQYLTDKALLMDELFLFAEEIAQSAEIEQEGILPVEFSLNEESAKEYMAQDMVEFENGGYEPLSLTFDATVSGEIYKVYVTVVMDDQEMLTFEGDIFKWDEDMNEWLVYEGDWVRGPGLNLFDAPEM